MKLTKTSRSRNLTSVILIHFLCLCVKLVCFLVFLTLCDRGLSVIPVRIVINWVCTIITMSGRPSIHQLAVSDNIMFITVTLEPRGIF